MSLRALTSATREIQGASSDSFSDVDTTACAASSVAANSDASSPDTDDSKIPCIVQVTDSHSLVDGHVSKLVSVECLVQVDGLWRLHVKNGVYQHNHAVGAAQLKTYAESRTLDDTDVTDVKNAVDSMVI
ncbi:hypothetical protein PInf_016766 [Phytophthora infestans]|nr:hypothetical protein PInf_016766 [Phytophthora infestans]